MQRSMRLLCVLELYESQDSGDCTCSPCGSVASADQALPAQLSAPLRSLKNCRTTSVMRVLHEGKELPQETSLQWILDHVVATEALQQTADSSAGQIGDEAAARDPSSATITLHIAHCTPKGKARLCISKRLCACTA